MPDCKGESAVEVDVLSLGFTVLAIAVIEGDFVMTIGPRPKFSSIQ